MYYVFLILCNYLFLAMHRCYRQFTVQANTAFTITCDNFNVKGNNCKNDYVELFWGTSETYTSYCGQGGELEVGW